MLLEDLPKQIEELILDYKNQLEVADHWRIILRELYQRFEYFNLSLILYNEFWVY